MKKKTLWIGAGIGIGAAVVILAAAAWLGFRWFNSPAKKFVAYHQSFVVEKVLSWMEKTADGQQRPEDFSGVLNITSRTEDPKMDALLEKSSLRLDVRREAGSLAAAGDVTLLGAEVLSVAVTYDDGVLGFLLPQVDENYYVLDLDRLREERTGAAQTPQLSGKELRALLQTYFDVVYTAVNDRNVKAERNQPVAMSALGGGFTGTVYTFVPRAGDIESMLVSLAAHLEDSPELRGLVLRVPNADAVLRALCRWFSGEEDDTDTDAPPDALLLKLAAAMRDNAVRVGRKVEDSGFTWLLAVEGDAPRMIHLANGEGGGLVYEAAEENGAGEEALSVVLKGERAVTARWDTGDGSRRSGSFTLAGEDGDTVLTYDMDGGEKSVLGVPWGSCSLSGPDRVLMLEVAPAAGGGVDHVLTVDKAEGDGWMDHMTLTVNAAEGGGPVVRPDQPSVDISDYSEEELKELIGRLGRDLLLKMMAQLILSQLGL